MGKKKKSGKDKSSLRYRSPNAGYCISFAKTCHYLLYVLPLVNHNEQVLKPPLIYTEQNHFPATLERKRKKERGEKKSKPSTQLKITILFLDRYQILALSVPGL